jgi:hypothetical protein
MGLQAFGRFNQYPLRASNKVVKIEKQPKKVNRSNKNSGQKHY